MHDRSRLAPFDDLAQNIGIAEATGFGEQDVAIEGSPVDVPEGHARLRFIEKAHTVGTNRGEKVRGQVASSRKQKAFRRCPQDVQRDRRHAIGDLLAGAALNKEDQKILEAIRKETK